MSKLLCLLLGSLLLSGPAGKVITMKEDKVTQLIFPSNIKSFKGGFLPMDFAITTEDNVLYIQPVGDFIESNMNILTDDGCYYTFTVKYDPEATLFNFVFSDDDAIYKEKKIDGTPSSPQKSNIPAVVKNPDLDPICKKIMSNSGYITSGNVAKTKNTWLIIKGVYADNDHIYIRMELKNSSNIPYDIDFVAYSVQVLKQRRTTSQEDVQITPVYSYELPQTVSPKSKVEFIACFDKFTIGPEKCLSITSIERSGERNLNYELHNSMILEARNYE